jgi:hypothetical protein
MKVQKFNISKPTKYADRQSGEERTRWNNVGFLTVIQGDDGKISRIIEIPAIGLEARAFPIEEKKPEPVEESTPF